MFFCVYVCVNIYELMGRKAVAKEEKGYPESEGNNCFGVENDASA